MIKNNFDKNNSDNLYKDAYKYDLINNIKEEILKRL